MEASSLEVTAASLPQPAESRDAEDARAIQDFLRGHSGKLGLVMKRHQTSVYNFCLRMLNDRAAAEDATQEVFLKVVRGAKSWRPTAKVRTWMFSIARNHCIDELRKASHRKTDSLDRPLHQQEADGITLGQSMEDPAAINPEKQVADQLLRPRLLQALESLPDAQREVFVLREHADLSFPEIAKVVGAPENTVKSRMRYALEHLRRSLAASTESGSA